MSDTAKLARLSARELIDLALDEGSFVSWDRPLRYPDDAAPGADAEYVEQLVAAAEKFGLPIHAIGVGERLGDLRPFDARQYADALTGVSA